MLYISGCLTGCCASVLAILYSVMLLTLPDEVILLILQKLLVRDLSRIARVCKALQVLADDEGLWRELCEQAGFPITDDSPLSWKGFYRSSSGFVFNRNCCNAATHIIDKGDRYCTENSTAGSAHFHGIQCLPEIPQTGCWGYTARVTGSPQRPSISWLGFGVSSKTWNPSSCGFWDSNGGCGMYSMGSVYAFDQCISHNEGFRPGDIVECIIERETSTIAFRVNDETLFTTKRERIATERFWPCFILQRDGTAVELLVFRSYPSIPQ